MKQENNQEENPHDLFYLDLLESEKQEIIDKKTELKNYNSYIFSILQNFEPTKYFNNPLYISSTGNTANDFQDFLSRLHRCSSNTLTATTYNNDTGEITKTELLEKVVCSQYSICPICASSKRSKLIRQVMPLYKTLLSLNWSKTAQTPVYMYEATIAFKGTNNPSNDYDFLRSSWNAFIKKGQRRTNKRKLKNGEIKEYHFRGKGEAGKIIGTLLSIEIIREQKNDQFWHIHGHCLIVCDSELNNRVFDEVEAKKLYKEYGFGNVPKQFLHEIALDKENVKIGETESTMLFSKLTREWFEATKETGLSFWVRPLRDGKNTAGNYTSLEAKIYEILKYVTKVTDLSQADLFILWDVIRNKKRISKSGIFANYKSSIEILNNLLSSNDLHEKYEQLITNYLPAGDDEESDEDEEQHPEETIFCENTFFESEQRTYKTEKNNDCKYDKYKSEEYKHYLKIRALLTNKVRTNCTQLFTDYKENIIIDRNYIQTKKIIKHDNKQCLLIAKYLLLSQWFENEDIDQAKRKLFELTKKYSGFSNYLFNYINENFPDTVPYRNITDYIHITIKEPCTIPDFYKTPTSEELEEKQRIKNMFKDLNQEQDQINHYTRYPLEGGGGG